MTAKSIDMHGGLLRRYRNAWSNAWSQRHTLRMPDLRPHEAEFLPDALALQAKPVSPVGRGVAWIVMALVATTFAWATLGKLDIVVDADGHVVPSDRTKTVTAEEVGVVRALHVREGQFVHAGEPLLELDTRGSDSERDRALVDRQAVQLQAARARAMLQALDSGHAPVLLAQAAVPAAALADARHQLQDQWRDYEAKQQRLAGDIQRFSDALPLATRRAEDLKALATTHDVPQHDWMTREQERVDLEGQLRDARDQSAALVAETRKASADALAEAQRTLDEAAQDALRAEVHSQWLRLVAPVDGTVQQLSVHTVGAAVPAAQPLMQIVPSDGPVEIEAQLDNKDVGFVREGQSAQVKVDAFPYTRYGTVPAHVVQVSRDAVQDEKRGWVYTVKVALDRPTLQVDGRTVRLSPGMTTKIDIRTGTRRVIDYVLSPLTDHVDGSLHER